MASAINQLHQFHELHNHTEAYLYKETRRTSLEVAPATSATFSVSDPSIVMY